MCLGQNGTEILNRENLYINYHRVCWRREGGMVLVKGQGGQWPRRREERGMASALVSFLSLL